MKPCGKQPRLHLKSVLVMEMQSRSRVTVTTSSRGSKDTRLEIQLGGNTACVHTGAWLTGETICYLQIVSGCLYREPSRPADAEAVYLRQWRQLHFPNQQRWPSVMICWRPFHSTTLRVCTRKVDTERNNNQAIKLLIIKELKLNTALTLQI